MRWRALTLLLPLLIAQPPLARAQDSQGLVQAHAAILAGPLAIPECSPLVVEDAQPAGSFYPFVISCRVVDATGSGNGWHVLITASHADGPGAVPPEHAPATARTLAEVTAVSQEVLAGHPALATGAISYPVPLFQEQPAAVFDSAPESGMGQMLVTVNGRISRQQFIRFGAPALTFSIVAGP